MRRLCLLAALTAAALADPAPVRFVLLGDRTGEAQPGAWEQVWHEMRTAHPDFVVGVGDTIQGGNDSTAAAEWRDVEKTLAPYRAIPLYLAPGNHDVWSPLSESLFRQFTAHPLHYSFDRGPAHFTILDNSRSDALPPSEIAFLESDLAAHQSAPVKFVISHRPSWILEAGLGNIHGAFHTLMRRYGVRYVIAGHVHQLLHAELEGVTYLSLPSAGGHLRASGQFRDGWFFGYTLVTLDAAGAHFEVHQLGQPHTTTLADWGLTGLNALAAHQ